MEGPFGDRISGMVRITQTDRARPPSDPRDAEIERLKRERDEARARAEHARASLSGFAARSKAFASTMHDQATTRRRERRRLTGQYQVGRCLEASKDLDAAAPKLFEILGREVLGRELEWEKGVLWKVDEEAGVVRCEGVWDVGETAPDPSDPAASGDAFADACLGASYACDEGLPGRAWGGGEALLFEDVTENGLYERDPRREAFLEEGLRGAAGFPIRDGGRTAAVFEFLSRRRVPEADEDITRVMLVVGNQIGQFVERRRAEEEREKLARAATAERARFEAVLRQMPAGVFIADPEGNFVLSNEEATRVYGQQINSVEECDRNVSSYPNERGIPPENLPLHRSLAGEVVSGNEHYVDRPDGTRLVVSANSAPVRDEEGNIVAAVKAFEDVTWRKEAEAALRESQERLSTIAEGAPVVLFALDREGVFTTSVGRGLQLLDLEPGEMVGRSVFDVYADEPEILEDVRRVLSGEAFTVNRTIGGVVFETSHSPLRDEEGEVVGVIGVAHDVTERVRAQEERERYLARERVARAQAEERRRISRDLHDRVAHSMGVVHQSLELYEALKEHNPQGAESRMELAREMAKEALASTRNLSLELRRPEVKKSLEAALADLLHDTVAEGISRNLSVEGDETLVPPQTRDQLFLVLREAVRNAMRHSGCESIAVRLHVGPEGAEGHVEDDGRGFDPAEALRRGSNGLSSMRERASLLGGTVNVTSAPGCGTKVEVYAPLDTPNGGFGDGPDGEAS